jgi:hypothetical protein
MQFISGWISPSNSGESWARTAYGGNSRVDEDLAGFSDGGMSWCNNAVLSGQSLAGARCGASWVEY